ASAGADERAAQGHAERRRDRRGVPLKRLTFAGLVAGLVAGLAAGCSVSSTALEGKQCSADHTCLPGYICDIPTNAGYVSVRDGGSVGTAVIQSCLGGPTTELYRYAGVAADWNHNTSWLFEANDIRQTSGSASDALTFTTASALMNVNDYHVTARFAEQSAL